MKKMLFFLLPLMLYSCEGKKQEKVYEPSEWRMTYDDYDYLMRYVCVDRNNCLHSTRECDVLDSVYCVEFIDTAYLVRENYTAYCSECVNIPRFEHIEDITLRNARNTISLGIPYPKK